MIDQDEDGLTFAIRVVERARLDSPLNPKLKLRGKSSFDAGFTLAKRVILQQLKDEQNRRFKRMLTK